MTVSMRTLFCGVRSNLLCKESAELTQSHPFLLWGQHTFYSHNLVLVVLQAARVLSQMPQTRACDVMSKQLPHVPRGAARVKDEEAQAPVLLLLHTHDGAAVAWAQSTRVTTKPTKQPNSVNQHRASAVNTMKLTQ